MTRKILTAPRRETTSHSAGSLENALLVHHRLLPETPAQRTAFSREVGLRLTALENQDAIRMDGDSWTLDRSGMRADGSPVTTYMIADGLDQGEKSEGEWIWKMRDDIADGLTAAGIVG